MSSSKTWAWRCQECGKVFRTVKAAERAADQGCPKCGGVDVDYSLGMTPLVVADPSEAEWNERNAR